MNWLGAHKRMKVINPGRTIGAMYDKDEAREKIIGFCPELTTAHSDYWLICLAELHPIKRHSVLLSAFAVHLKTHSNNRLVLIGEGSSKTAIETQIKNLGITNNVFVLGAITEAARFLKAFDAFVLASKSESYGYVLHEAGLAGIPIIATNVGGIPDIITNGEDGILIQPDNVPTLTQAIKEIQENPHQAQMRADHLKQTLNIRTVVKMTRQTESLYSL
jgi:glycosyltransferase involved in cell wall biosynthesis